MSYAQDEFIITGARGNPALDLKLSIRPYFVQPVGAIEWTAELTLGGGTIAHVTRAQSRDDANALISDRIEEIITALRGMQCRP